MEDSTKTTSMHGNRGCVACGASNTPAARFCAQCGASLPPLSDDKVSQTAKLISDAREHLTLQRFEEAALAGEAALVLDPDSAEAHHIVAQARIKQGMRRAALTHAERAAQLDPGNPEFQSTLISVQEAESSFDWRQPSFLAAAAATGVLILFVLIGMSLWGGHGNRAPRMAMSQAEPAAQSSPFARTDSSQQGYPQPTRPVGSTAGKPRVPARASAPGPADLLGNTEAAAPSSTVAGLPAAGQSAAVGLAPVPVDTTLHRFPAIEAPKPAAAVKSTTRKSATTARTEREPVVVPPAPQPGGGTLFGGTGFGPARSSTEEPASTSAAEAPAAQEPVARRSSPQQAYKLRDYSAAIGGYLTNINNGQATGANYLQLGLAYERVGDKANAAAAFRAAIKAYDAQLRAGTDPDVASRGLRTSKRSLMLLESR